jgi:CelD/BcsL family acetyltransferase involved in cellulose biosynthesis
VLSPPKPADEAMLAAKRTKVDSGERGSEPTGLRTELIEDEATLAALAAPWDALAVAASRPYCAPAWMLAWWRHARPDGAGLRVVAVHEGSELIGIAPFWALDADARHSQYEILGARLCAPTGPLAASGREQEVAAAIVDVLASARPRPSEILLEDLVPPLGFGDHLAAAWPRRRPWALVSAPDPLRTISLKGLDFDGWLATLSSKFRQEARRQRRRLEEAGAEFVLAGPDQVGRALDAFDDLHGARLADSDALVPGLHGMLAEVARELGPSGRLRIFTIEAEGRVVAVNIVLAAGDEVSGWNSGFDESWQQKLSPSLQLTLHVIGDAAERGDALFNLGPGSQGYKQRLADGQQEFAYTRLVPRGRRYPLIRLRLAPGQVRSSLASRLSADAKQRLRRLGRG